MALQLTHWVRDNKDKIYMKIQLIEGQFKKTEAIALISDLIQTKIKFHESRILSASNEEDIKYRESKIIFLQNQLGSLRHEFDNEGSEMKISATITVE